jgi:predicted DNA-binding transcriptional regulator AlpA
MGSIEGTGRQGDLGLSHVRAAYLFSIIQRVMDNPVMLFNTCSEGKRTEQTMKPAQDEDLRVLRYSDLKALGIGGRTRIWGMIKAGEFPAPIDLGGGRVGWSASTIHAWLKERRIAPAYARGGEAA